MSQDPIEYPPLTSRHKRIFGIAGIAAVAFAVALSLGRLALIRWWIVTCGDKTLMCRASDFAFTWWWVALVLGLLGIAFAAHRLTLDRLRIE